MGITFENLEGMSVRQQREIIKNWCKEMNKFIKLKYKYQN